MLHCSFLVTAEQVFPPNVTMVQGPRTKTRKTPSLQLDYTIHIHEIKPWPPSQSLKTIRAALIQWEHGERKSGSTNQVVPSVETGSGIGDGKIEFNESFKLPVTLVREMSMKGVNGDSFQKNCVEFNLYEPRRDKTVKGQLIGTAVLDLAEYGVVRDSLCLSVPINCKRTYWNSSQPLLFVKIQSVERGRASSSSKDGLVREASLDRSTLEEYIDEAAEVASFVTDDDVSSHSSVGVTLAGGDANANGSFLSQNKEDGMNGSAGEPKSDEDQVIKSRVSSSRSSSVDLSSDLTWISNKISSTNLPTSAIDNNKPQSFSENEADKIQENVPNNGMKDPSNDPRDDETSEKHHKCTKAEDEPSSGFSQVDVLKQGTSDNDSEEKFAVNGKLSSIDRSKHVKSVRSSLDSSRSNGSVRNSQLLLNSESKDSKMYVKEPKNVVSETRIEHLEHRMKMLEAELREAAGIEVSLYSVIAEHGSSINKVHAPARRLLRLYFHASKQNSKSRIGSAAKSIVSGLVLVSKACGNDVPRLTFWLSNSVVLRVIMSKSFGDGKLPISVEPVNGTSGEWNRKKKASPLKWESFPNKNSRNAIEDSFGDWENPATFVAALEKVESWVFSRIIESIWWQTFTPHMQSGNANEIRSSLGSESSKLYRRTSSSTDEQQGNLSLELWKKAFRDACERICPVRAGGHDCGCLPDLARVIMEQLIARLDVAMFNAILRESADEIPTDPIADPISDAEVLPIPAGKASFGAGAQLKNAIGNWSRWLTDLFGIDDDDLHEDADETTSHDTSSKSFHHLNALSDLMMLPKDLLLSQTVRKEVCPTFGPPLIRRVLSFFVPDEFCPDPIPNVVLEALSSADSFDSEDGSIMNFPCASAPIVYQPPQADSVAIALGEFGTQPQLSRSRSSVLKKSQTSDDELEELDSPLKSIILDGFQASPSSVLKENGSRNALRYQLLRDVWME
ncbi:hypothetical protein STAS_07332 [Striga asiatica]|uniref:C2 NT-type domain-containing protein n=1 Tax=Striga asiatica TaxID=4170 RepID=A0A5A7PF62_STRAF|nr:hypothetical protein STAS_07332 [Striga asiatica]